MCIALLVHFKQLSCSFSVHYTFFSFSTFYFLLHRGKLNDLNAENARLKNEIENSSEENSSFLTYEKR